ncbi:MAG: DHA1 family tetracycline resistance protein-like MFS transporter [Glaciecola sp.]|jgi:DHA1 family tetracycline resistance protein-like MFS transporter
MVINSKQRTNATRFVLLTVFVYSMGFGIIMPILPELIMELEGVSLSRATLIGGFIASAYAVFQFLFGPMVGNLGDRFGRRPVFLLSLMGFSIDFFLMGFAPNIIWLFVGRAVAGGLGAIFGPANAAMADISTGENRAKGFGMVGAAFGIGFIIGPALGGVLGDFGTRIPFFVAAGLAMATFIYGWFAFPETMLEEDRRPFSFRRANPIGAFLSLSKLPNVLGISVVFFMWVISANVYAISWAYFAPAQYGWDSKAVGLSLAVVGISMAFVQIFLIGRMVSRFGERTTAITAMIAGLGSLLFYAFVENSTLAMIFLLFVGFQGMAMPCINAMMSRRTPSDMQGELQGYNGSMSALAALAAPLIYNTSLSYYTSDAVQQPFAGAPFLIAAGLACLALIMLILTKPVEPQSS